MGFTSIWAEILYQKYEYFKNNYNITFFEKNERKLQNVVEVDSNLEYGV